MLEDAVEAAAEGSDQRNEAEQTLAEYKKKEEKKLWKKQMSVVEDLRAQLATMDEDTEEKRAVEAQVEEILQFWKSKQDSKEAEEEIPAPLPPSGYKWGSSGGSTQCGALSEGALWDLGNLLLGAVQEEDFHETVAVLQLAQDSGVDMIHLLTKHRTHPEAYCTLHLAALSGNSKVLELLLSFNPDVEEYSRDGATPLSLAIDRGHRKCIQLLRLRGAKVNRDHYFDYDRNGSPCYVDGCHRAAVGFKGVCERHAKETYAVIIAHGEAKVRSSTLASSYS